MADSGAYRSALEVQELMARDPVKTFREKALAAGWVDEAALDAIEKQVQDTVTDAVTFAADSPDPDDVRKDVYAEPFHLYGGSR